jgi:amino acid exporter
MVFIPPDHSVPTRNCIAPENMEHLVNIPIVQPGNIMHDIALYLPGILLAYSAFFLAIASPGPNILAVIGTSMSVGRASGIALAFGVATGSFTWAVLTVIGLSALLSTYASALVAIKIFGGLYLLWLAYKSFKSAASKHDIEAKELAGALALATSHAATRSK